MGVPTLFRCQPFSSASYMCRLQGHMPAPELTNSDGFRHPCTWSLRNSLTFPPAQQCIWKTYFLNPACLRNTKLGKLYQGEIFWTSFLHSCPPQTPSVRSLNIPTRPLHIDKEGDILSSVLWRIVRRCVQEQPHSHEVLNHRHSSLETSTNLQKDLLNLGFPVRNNINLLCLLTQQTLASSQVARPPQNI